MNVGIGLESTRGVGVAPTYWLNVVSQDFKDIPTRAKSEASFSSIVAGDQAPLTLTHAEGEIEVEIGDQSLGLLLTAIVGDQPTSVNTDVTAYTHTFTLQNDNEHDSLTIHTIDPIGQLAYELAMVDSAEIRVEPNAIITMAINFMSKASADSSAQASTYLAEKKFVGRFLQFKTAATASGLTAASVTKLKSATIRFEKNAEVQNTLATVQPEDVVNKRFNITGEFTLDYEDRTFLNFVKNANNRAMRFDFIHEDTISGSSSVYQFTLDLSKVMIEAFEPDFALDDIVTQTFNWTALYDAGGNDNVINSFTLVNAVISY